MPVITVHLSHRVLSACRFQPQTTEAVGVGSVGHAPLTYTHVYDARADVSADASTVRRHVQQQGHLATKVPGSPPPDVPGLGCKSNVLQVRKKPRDTPREDVLGHVLRMHAGFRI